MSVTAAYKADLCCSTKKKKARSWRAQPSLTWQNNERMRAQAQGGLCRVWAKITSFNPARQMFAAAGIAGTVSKSVRRF